MTERRHLTVKAFHSSLITYWAFAHLESVKQMGIQGWRNQGWRNQCREQFVSILGGEPQALMTSFLEYLGF